MSNFQDELKAHLKAAKAYSELSHARRLKVGAVLVRDGRIISTGRNGTPTGYNNNCEIIVDGKLKTRPEVIHAEMNVILFAARNGLSTDGCTLVTTNSPCFACAQAVIQAGIKKVFYADEYRNIDGLEFLKDCGVIVSSISSIGE